MKLNRKNKLLLVLSLGALVVCYFLGFSKTIQYYNAYNSNNDLLLQNANNPDVISKLLEKEKQIDKALERYHFEGETSFQNVLLKNINASIDNKNIKVVNFREEHLFVENGITNLSYFFTLEGSFNSILKTISEIENKPYLGFVKHISVDKKFDYKKNYFYIHVDIILQRSFEE